MKDENNGQIMEEFVGLKFKMYSFNLHYSDAEKENSVIEILMLTLII